MNSLISTLSKQPKIVPGFCIVAVLFAAGTGVGTAIAQKNDKAVPKKQTTLALGEEEVKQFILLLDTDKNGKVSKKEFLSYMEAEFDRLDKDKSGELDPKELAQSEVRPSRPAVGK